MTQYLIRCGKLYDGLADVLRENQEILVQGERIAKVGEHLAYEGEAQIIDLSHLTVTPGLSDAHVHMSYFDYREIGKDAVYYSDSMRTLAAAECARRALSGGFTTVRHVGWFREDNILDVKRAIEAGYVDGARIVAAPHFLCTPGSHGDTSQSYRSNPMLSRFLGAVYPTMGSGMDFFRNAVREEVKLGADFIKIMATGGFFTPNDSPEDIQLSDDELKAIIDTAKSLGRTVTAHAYTDKLIQKLVQFGIDGIEHASLAHAETFAMMKERGVYLVPTFCPYEEIVHYDEEMMKTKPVEMQKKLFHYRDNLVESRREMLESGLELGYGTDLVSGYNNYECGREYAAFQRSGVSPFTALAGATRVNAKILRIEGIGAIAEGYRADLAGWRRDLLSDPYALLDCAFVMKDGREYPARAFVAGE